MIRRPPRSPLFPYPPLFRSPQRSGPRTGRRESVAHQVREQRTDLVGLSVDGAERLDKVVADHPPPDRKSTRLNSSYANISYAVFCLKKKHICLSYLSPTYPG